jgi:predicted PurR-regulated permease PerM
MPDPLSVNTGDRATSRTLESAIHIGLLALLLFWCLLIIRPFLIPMVWGIVIAVAGYPTYRSLCKSFGGRRVLASVAFSLLLFLAILVPAALLGGTLVEGAIGLAEQVREGQFRIPPPAPGVAEWPLLGAPLAAYWASAAENLQSTLVQIAPHLKEPAQWLLGVVADAGVGLLQFLFAIVIAGAVMVHGERAASFSAAVARRLGGSRGEEFAALAGATVRSVTRGILGVAFIQATLAGLGFLAAGVPAAGLWALIALILSVVQIGVFPVVIPILIYVFFTADMLTFALFLVWSLFVGVIDNVLKPLLLGRGVTVPMWVVFVGAIGGLLSHGLIGLFVGPVVLVLGYALLLVWVQQGAVPAANAGNAQQAGTNSGSAGDAAPGPARARPPGSDQDKPLI